MHFNSSFTSHIYDPFIKCNSILMVHEMCMKHVTVACIYFVLYFLQHSGLHFRHTDNTVQWLRAMESVGLPKVRSKYTLLKKQTHTHTHRFPCHLLSLKITVHFIRLTFKKLVESNKTKLRPIHVVCPV